MSNSSKSGRSGDAKLTRALLLGASLTSIAVVGGTTGARAASAAEEACAFAMKLRSPYTVERVLTEFPNDRCVPLMLGALQPSLLAQLNKDVVMSLPASQLKLIPKDVLDQVGTVAPMGMERMIAPKYESQY